MAPLDQRIKIAMLVGAKTSFLKNKTRGERALLRITQVLKQLPEQKLASFYSLSLVFSGQPQKEEQFTRNSAAGPALLTRALRTTRTGHPSTPRAARARRGWGGGSGKRRW